MKGKIIAIATAGLLMAGTAFYGFSSTQNDCSLKGTSECPMVKDCPLKGTPDCPYKEGCCAEEE